MIVVLQLLMPCVRQQKLLMPGSEGTREVTENVKAPVCATGPMRMLKPSTLEEVEGGEEA